MRGTYTIGRIAEGLLIAGWSLAFVGTADIVCWVDFLIVGLGALACLFLGTSGAEALCPAQRRICAVFCAAFAAATILSNYDLFLPIRRAASIARLALTGAGSFTACWAIFSFAMKRLPLKHRGGVNPNPSAHRARPWRVFLLSFLASLAVYWLYLFFVAYPGYFTQDTKSAFQNIVDHWYGKSIPIYFTLLLELCLNIGYFFGGAGNSALVVYSLLQTVAMAAAGAYAVVTLYEKGLPKICLAAVWMIYSLLSYQVACSVMIWKDIPFSIAAFTMAIAIYRAVTALGNKKGNLAVFALSAGVFCLSRTNGWYSLLALGVLMVLLLRRKNKTLLAITGAVLAAGWVLLNPVLDRITTSRTDYLEIMSVPLQQVSRVIWSDYDIPPEDEELLSQVLDLEMVAERYAPGTVDPIKFYCFDRSQYGFFMEHLDRYASLWLRWGLAHPGDYLKAWVDVTKGYWSIGWYYGNYYAIEGTFEPLGFAILDADNPVKTCFSRLFQEQERSAVLRVFYSTGLQVWIILGCMVICACKKRKEYWLGLPALVILAGLWLCTPVFNIFRYAYAAAMSMPVLLCLTVFDEPGKQTETE